MKKVLIALLMTFLLIGGVAQAANIFSNGIISIETDNDGAIFPETTAVTSLGKCGYTWETAFIDTLYIHEDFIFTGDTLTISNADLQVIDDSRNGCHVFRVDHDTGNVAIAGDVAVEGFIRPGRLADTAAPINSIYYSSTQGKVVYKDWCENVMDLY